MSRALFLLLTALVATAMSATACADDARPEPRQAMPGYDWTWPRDHGAHDDFRTEWWYYVGHLDAADDSGRTFGFQLTFFRSMVEPDADDAAAIQTADSAFAVEQMYWAHFAISDLENGQFYHAEALQRGGVGVAGAREDLLNVWNGKWSAEMLGDIHHLRADMRDRERGKEWTVRLALTPEKPIVLQGDAGYSQKAGELGQASLYYSIPRLKVDGVIYEDDAPIVVGGSAWLDREFGSNQLQDGQVGWDWFALQLDDGSELMVYHIRLADGSYEPNSSGAWIAEDGTARTLKKGDFTIRATETWTSKRSGGEYPAGWVVELPSEGLTLRVAPSMADQELHTERTGRLDYWEGSVQVEGERRGEPVAGRGYVELVGYAQAFDRDI